ncbi:peptidase domain-containing ABC transporter [Polyangium sp. y55x31]|uniref:peptidase domain-containing ABC transporter n=1 Tax=Polyangium sp. y55x31 TaxID=3042688 RepID=UPI0024830C0B|nr:peptidase domain-containing ABC transporter [Polyangium sp. y55x31]MDI1483415.1 peptidase domain-containing ABC transporter [Polyangium sp. y55x31]
MDEEVQSGDPRRRFPALARLGQKAKRIPFIQQLASTECGVACLAMVLGYHGKNVPYEELRSLVALCRGGTTAREILRAARYHGLRGRGVRLEPRALGHLPTASILHWEFDHFVVLERVSKKGIDIIDPGAGRLRLPLSEVDRSFTGVALVFEPSEHFPPPEGASKRTPSSGYHGILRESGAWGRIVTTSFFLQAMLLALPLLTGTVVDRVVPRSDLHMLLVLAIGIAGIVVFHLLASLVRAHLLLDMRTSLDARMTLSFLEHLIALPYAFFQRRSTGDLLMRLNSNTLIRQILTSGMLSALLDGTMAVGYLALLFLVSWRIGLLALAFGIAQVGILALTSKKRRELDARMLARQARAEGYQVEMFANVETLKSMGAEERALEQWSNLFVDVLNASLSEGKLDAAVEALGSTLRMSAPLVVLWVGAIQVLDGKISLGVMLALNALAAGVFAPLSSLASNASKLELLGCYLERAEDVRRTPPEQAPGSKAMKRVRGHIELERVSFRYNPLDPLVVDDVSLRIEPGQFVAIVGRSGSGKTSLACLLAGLYRPDSGKILYDGINLADLDIRHVRSQLGIVTQKVSLFGTTIRDNIALGNPDATADEVMAAARQANLHDDIAAMPAGYDTVLADGGSSLSGGQRQRLALARALVRKPSVLLLDEATSALDAVTEARVNEELAKLRCTRIVIAHRLSTIRNADEILVMHEGRLVERGRHAELVARGGWYASLVATQMEKDE